MARTYFYLDKNGVGGTPLSPWKLFVVKAYLRVQFVIYLVRQWLNRKAG